MPSALQLVQQGYATGAADRNWASYGAEVDLPNNFPEWQRKLLCDPQTSGGLLVACALRRRRMRCCRRSMRMASPAPAQLEKSA